MMNLPIKNRKDWFLAFILTFLLVYALTGTYSHKYQQMLLAAGNFRLTAMNQPGSYGTLIVSVLITTIIAAIFMALLRKKGKVIALTLFSGTLLSVAMLGVYQLHCSLIASVIDTETPGSVSVYGKNHVGLELTEEQEYRLLDYCVALEPAEKAEAKRLKERLEQSEDSRYNDSIDIWFLYGRKYGHSFDYIIHVYEDIIYIRKGYGFNDEEIITICRDNGLLAFLDEMTTAR